LYHIVSEAYFLHHGYSPRFLLEVKYCVVYPWTDSQKSVHLEYPVTELVTNWIFNIVGRMTEIRLRFLDEVYFCDCIFQMWCLPHNSMRWCSLEKWTTTVLFVPNSTSVTHYRETGNVSFYSMYNNIQRWNCFSLLFHNKQSRCQIFHH
jgi:hypothetical protein